MPDSFKDNFIRQQSQKNTGTIISSINHVMPMKKKNGDQKRNAAFGNRILKSK